MAKFGAGTQRDYVIPLKEAVNRSYPRKADKAILTVKRFVLKHTRNPNVVLTQELNHFLWRTGKFKIPKKVNVTLKESEGRVFVYLKGSKQINLDVKKAKEKKEAEKKAAAGLVEKAKAKAQEVEEEEKKKLAEKKAKEKASEAAAMKRGQK